MEGLSPSTILVNLKVASFSLRNNAYTGDGDLDSISSRINPMIWLILFKICFDLNFASTDDFSH